MNDCWSGSSLPPLDNPSTVVTSLPPACYARMRQEITGSPAKRTVHAPHSPIEQPHFVPVSPISSRRKSRSVVFAATGSPCKLPLILILPDGVPGEGDNRLWIRSPALIRGAPFRGFPPKEAQASRARRTRTAITGSLYSVDQRRPVEATIAPATQRPAFAKRSPDGFEPVRICSASVIRRHVGNAAPGTMRASMILRSSSQRRRAATLSRAIERAFLRSEERRVGKECRS